MSARADDFLQMLAHEGSGGEWVGEVWFKKAGQRGGVTGAAKGTEEWIRGREFVGAPGTGGPRVAQVEVLGQAVQAKGATMTMGDRDNILRAAGFNMEVLEAVGDINAASMEKIQECATVLLEKQTELKLKIAEMREVQDPPPGASNPPPRTLVALGGATFSHNEAGTNSAAALMRKAGITYSSNDIYREAFQALNTFVDGTLSATIGGTYASKVHAKPPPDLCAPNQLGSTNAGASWHTLHISQDELDGIRGQPTPSYATPGAAAQSIVPKACAALVQFPTIQADWKAMREVYQLSRNQVDRGLHPGTLALIQGQTTADLGTLDTTVIDEDLQPLFDAMESQAGCIIEAYGDFKEAQAKVQEEFRVTPDLLRDTEDDLALAAAVLAVLESSDLEVGDETLTSAQRVIFKEQCFLLSYISAIAKEKATSLDPLGVTAEGRSTGLASRNTGAKRYPGKLDGTAAAGSNASVQVQGEPYGFLNRLTLDSSMGTMFDIPHHELSNLQPMIRLYKIEYKQDGSAKQVEMKFDSAAIEGAKATSDGITSVSLHEALQDHRKRGFGVGIKKFSLTYDGSNPFAVKKSIKANLQIFANSFDELFAARRSPEGESYSYVDLALKTKGETEISVAAPAANRAAEPACGNQDAIDAAILRANDNLEKLNFRLKAVIGWAQPNGANIQDLTIADSVYNSHVTLNLTPTVHNFEIDEQSRVVFNINYLAYIEDFFDQEGFNVFAAQAGTPIQKTVTWRQLIRNLQLSYYGTHCQSSQLDLIRKQMANAVANEKKESLQSLMNDLITSRKVYFLNIPYPDVQNFLLKGPHHSFNPDEGLILDDIGSAAALQTEIAASLQGSDKLFSQRSDQTTAEFEAVKRRFTASLLGSGRSTDSMRLPFFFVSDLVDIVLRNIGLEIEKLPKSLRNINENDIDDAAKLEKVNQLIRMQKQFERFRVLLGPLELVNHANVAKSTFVCFGDIPISVRYFLEWLSERVIRKDQSTYSLTKFLNDLFNNLIKNFLNSESCFQHNIKQKVRINQSVVTSYPPAGYVYDSITQLLRADKAQVAPYWGSRATISTRNNEGLQGYLPPILNISGELNSPLPDKSVDQEVNWLVYYAARTQPVDLMKGNKHDDANRGIFHYLLGRDRGLIKDIKLTKTSTPGLAEVRFEQDGYDGLRQLRVVYDAQIETYANVKAFPGTYIYIDPGGFAPNFNGFEGTTLDLTEFGIGGYYMVYKSEHTFGEGMANTTLHAKWVNQLEKESQSADCQASRDNDAGNNISKCRGIRADRGTGT